MKHYLSRYLHSFYLNKIIVTTLAIDVSATLLITGFWFLFNKLLEWRLYLLTGGKSVDALKATLLSGSSDTTQLFLHNTKVFAYLFFIGIILLFILTVLITASSQAAVWSVLTKQKMHYNYKKLLPWCKLFLVFLLFAAAAFVLSTLILLLLTFILPASLLATPVIAALVKSICVVLFLLWCLLILVHFQERQQILSSLSASLQWIKAHRRIFLLSLFFAIITFILFNLLVENLLPKGFTLVASPFTLFSIKIGIFLIYFNWLRWYIFSEMKENSVK